MIESGEIKKMMPLAKIRIALLGIAIPMFLASCVGEKQSIIYDTFKLGITNPNAIIDAAPLNPSYRYLKVEANGQPALLVLGYVDQKHKATQDVWYSAFKEIIEIKGGRLANTEGLETNWTEVTLVDPPALLEALKTSPSANNKRFVKYRYIRTRTVMPGYHVNIRETVVMEAINDIPSGIPKVLRDPENNPDIRWVKETVLAPPQSRDPSIKPLEAVYAINTKTSEVVYGKQYLSPDFYISWLSWPYPKVINAGNTADSSKLSK